MYVPSTDRVRNSYANEIARPAIDYGTPEYAQALANRAKEHFDKWLAEYVRKIAEDVWDRCTEAHIEYNFAPVTSPEPQNPFRVNSKGVPRKRKPARRLTEDTKL